MGRKEVTIVIAAVVMFALMTMLPFPITILPYATFLYMIVRMKNGTEHNA